MKNKYIKSPLNYVGGKYKLLPQILPLFPKHVSTFVDLFCGGGNVGINIKAKQIIFNDMNSRIIDLFRYLQGHTIKSILSSIYKIINTYSLSKINKSGFLKLRKNYNQHPTSIKLYVLVAYSFNYQFRFNNQMQYNNPFGKNRSHFSSNMKNNLIRFTNRLHSINAIFKNHDFTKLNVNQLDTFSFVYADPPYLITDGSYNDGNRGFKNWTFTSEHTLYKLLDILNKHHIKFALSNVTKHKGVLNYSLLSWLKQRPYVVHDLHATYKNASYNTKRLNSQEVLITNY